MSRMNEGLDTAQKKRAFFKHVWKMRGFRSMDEQQKGQVGVMALVES